MTYTSPTSVRGRLLLPVLGALLPLMTQACAPSPEVESAALETRGFAPRILVDPRVELLGIVFHLAGNPEYGMGRVPAYDSAVATWFGPVAEHEAVRLARWWRETHGASFNAVPSLAVHLTPPPGLSPRVPLSTAPGLDARWNRADPGPFLAALRAFAVESRFDDFLAVHENTYAAARASLGEVFRRGIDPAWFGDFFGVEPAAEFLLMPAVLNGGANYALRFVPAGRGEIWAVMGVGGTDSAGAPRFTDGIIPTIVHEFNHAFVNPLVDRHGAGLEEPGGRLFASAEQEMRQLAYGDGDAVVKESLVRAAVARYIATRDDQGAALREVRTQQRLGFLWMEELYDLLGAYEADRAAYPRFEALMPRLAAYFADLAVRLPAVRAAYDDRRPRILEVLPDSGSTDVDPTLAAVRVRFDRPMAPAWGLNRAPGRPPGEFPPMGGITWDAAGETVRIPVRLEPGRAYSFVLTGMGFYSRDGYAIRPYLIEFTTGSPDVD